MKILHKTQKWLYLLYFCWHQPSLQAFYFGITNIYAFWSDVEAQKGIGLLQEAALLQLTVKYIIMQVCEYLPQKFIVFLHCYTVDQYGIQKDHYSYIQIYPLLHISHKNNTGLLDVFNYLSYVTWELPTVPSGN